LTATTDDKDIALMAMIPEAIRDQLSPTELVSRVQAARLILADADLKGTDKALALRDIKRLMESVPLRSFFAAHQAAQRLKSTDPRVMDDVADLARRNPAVRLFYDGLNNDIQAQILAELYTDNTDATAKPRRRFFGRNKVND
jgi:hypothetical protein